jgi:hypothetical protein
MSRSIVSSLKKNNVLSERARGQNLFEYLALTTLFLRALNFEDH